MVPEKKWNSSSPGWPPANRDYSHEPAALAEHPLRISAQGPPSLFGDNHGEVPETRRILAIGVSYRKSPINIREKLCFSPHHLDDSLKTLKRFVPEGAILSTCHRVELYAASNTVEETEGALLRFWSLVQQVQLDEFRPYLYRLTDRDAAEHLFRVSCGLDSAIVGESQVLGQVRQALNRGVATKSMGHVLSAMFRMAVSAGRRARAETGINRNAASIGSAAVEAAKQQFGDLSTARVLLVGTGKMGELAAKSLLNRGASEIAVVGHTAKRARRLALICGSTSTLTQLDDGLRQCDIVITGTSAPHHILLKEAVERAMEQRSRRPLLIIDIAVPRDVEPEVSGVPGVTLLNIDDLQGAVRANLRDRQAEAERAREIIAGELSQFTYWQNVQKVVPTIAALVQRADEIRDMELARTSEVLDRLPEGDRQRIEAMTAAFQKKLLHRSIMLLRMSAAGGDGIEASRMVSTLFGLDHASDCTELEETA